MQAVAIKELPMPVEGGSGAGNIGAWVAGAFAALAAFFTGLFALLRSRVEKNADLAGKKTDAELTINERLFKRIEALEKDRDDIQGRLDLVENENSVCQANYNRLLVDHGTLSSAHKTGLLRISELESLVDTLRKERDEATRQGVALRDELKQLYRDLGLDRPGK